MKQVIYKLQNKLNGKIYIGRTKQSLPKRMSVHRRSSDCKYLYNALKKYGEDVFTKEIIYETDNEDDLCNKERELILKYNSLSPNGYNLVLETNQGRTFHDKTKSRMSMSHQGKCHRSKTSSKYLGVRKRDGMNEFDVRINKHNKTYSNFFCNEIEAAEAYDKVALYLYGLNARINFPENVFKYRTINLRKFFESFCNPHHYSSKFRGVCKTGIRRKTSLEGICL